jgi:EmrB/QacA subfamily drug resistance transporter
MMLPPSSGTTGKASFQDLDPHVRRIAIVVVLGSIMTVLDTTIINVALDTLSKDLHSSLSEIQWVVSAYLLALAAVIPLTAWAGRRFGAYRVYMAAIILFTLGSALCGMATSTSELIAFRVVQGVGGGMLMPIGMTLLVQAAGRENLPTVMSAIGVPMVLAPVFGPTLGGLLLQSVSWHAIFLINVPIGIATAFVAPRLLPRVRPEPGEAGRLDWLGLVLAASGTVGVTYGLSQSATTGSISSPLVVWPIMGGLVLIGLFVLRSRRVAQPLLDLELYRVRAFSAATVVMFFLGAALFGAMILLPLYFQVARAEDAIRTGLMLIPQALGSAIGMKRSAGAIHRLGAGLTSLGGGIILVIATIPFLFISDTTPYLLIAIAMVIRGIGIGFAMMPAMTAAFGSVRHDQIHDASPQLNVIQRVGGSLGTAVIAVVLQANLTHLVAPASASGIANAFAQTYWWVLGMSAVALIPSVILWRVERRAHLEPEESEMDTLTVEALA